MRDETAQTSKAGKPSRPAARVESEGGVRNARSKTGTKVVVGKSPQTVQKVYASVSARRSSPKRVYQSIVGEAVHTAISDLQHSGLVSKQAMRESDAECLAPPAMSASKIKRLRQRLSLSQKVLAAYLNTTPSTVVQWESGAKQPGGMGLKLLYIAEKKGPSGLEL